MKYFVYLARYAAKSLYIASCTNLKSRENKYNKGKGAKYKRKRRPVKIVYFKECDTLIEARKREVQIKR